MWTNLGKNSVVSQARIYCATKIYASPARRKLPSARRGYAISFYKECKVAIWLPFSYSGTYKISETGVMCQPEYMKAGTDC